MITLFIVLYLVGAFVCGALMWKATAGTWESGPLWPHVRRSVALTATVTLFWPGALILVALFHYSKPRRLIERFVYWDWK